MLKEVLKIMFGMIFTQNYVLVQFIAICPFLGVSKKFDSCIGMSGAVIFVMTLASAVTHLIYQYVMVPNGLDYLSTIIFILVCVVGATGSGALMWDISDTLNGLMALPNLVALLLLS